MPLMRGVFYLVLAFGVVAFGVDLSWPLAGNTLVMARLTQSVGGPVNYSPATDRDSSHSTRAMLTP